MPERRSYSGAMRGLWIPILLTNCLAAPGAGALTRADCERHRAEFIASLEENRSNSIRQIDEAAREISDDAEKAHLEAQRNEAWEFEERMRAMGDRIFRDCMAHVRDSGG